VVAGAWRARDRSVGIALASIRADPVRINLDLKPYGLGGGARLFLTTGTGRRELPRSAGDSRIDIELGARGAAIVEVSPRGQADSTH